MVNKLTQITKIKLLEQEPFFIEIVSILRSTKSKKKINGTQAYNVKCPQCGCKQAALITARDRGTYKLICPNVPKNNGHCTLGSLTLHELVMRFAPTQTRTKWHKARGGSGERMSGTQSRTGPLEVHPCHQLNQY